MPKISVVTPSSRGVKVLTQLLRDFKNQTFADFEHVIVQDGDPPADVVQLMKDKGGPRTRFHAIKKDMGNMLIAPGTRPRNYGTQLAKGDYVCYFDDDDRAHCRYLETLSQGMTQDTKSIAVVQMSCQESRMYRNMDGKPDRIICIPGIGMPIPMICHIGTPCFMVPRQWALENPWQHEPEHDFWFLKRIVDKYHPPIYFFPRMLVDVDGKVLAGMRDWVDFPPFYRD